MSVNTINAYGHIFISDDAIASVVASTARECFGVVDLSDKKIINNKGKAVNTFRGWRKKGVNILTIDNKIYIDLCVILKYGISINAVGESLKRLVKYKVENFTGMIVDSVNIDVIGVK